MVNLSLGERGAPKDIPVNEYREMQRTATEKAARLLGFETAFLVYPDGEIPFNEESALQVCDAIREHKPDIVVTLCLAKSLHARKMNDLAQSSSQAFPVSFLP